MQPIISYNTGAGAYGRIKQIIKIGIVQSSIVIIVVMLIVYFAAYRIVPMFTGPVPELIEITVNAMRVFILLYALGNVSQLVAGYYIACLLYTSISRLRQIRTAANAKKR